MMTSKSIDTDASYDTEVLDIKRFRFENLTYEICSLYFMIYDLTFVILLYMITAVMLEGIRKT